MEPRRARIVKVLLRDHGTTPQKKAVSTWGQRVRALDEAGYVRYDERTATILGETEQLPLDLYRGDLRDPRAR